MIIVKKNGYLKYKNLKFRCALGKGGVKKKIKEGDNITPKGIFSITRIFYRQDKIKKIITKVKKIKIKKNMGWCDDSQSPFYNKQVKLPNRFGYEKLYREDDLYDIILILNYNTKPVIKNKGSAIFVHVGNKFYKKTRGCVALKKDHLIKLISQIKKNTKIKIG
jgi:L,D-peptidoglycan transpeptidase YkuD (ErfK/YbiS/YcfS/YnhG family)